MVENSLNKETPNGEEAFIRIFLADDHPVIRQSLRVFLEKQPDFKVVGEAGDGQETVKLVLELLPEVVIMDITMPLMNGIEAARLIKEEHPEIAILALTVHTEKEYILGILETGIAGYLTKSVFGKELVNAVRSVVSGEVVLTTSAFKQILSSSPRRDRKPTQVYAGEWLTNREYEVLKLAARGLNNKDIALRLDVSVHTVKNYLAVIFSKLHVGSRTEAVMVGLRAGLLTMNDVE
ncbi:MAG: response regulator transcription factor [Dehalococcoidales bacterium]|nr:response regulator transcription factor [Dehalococcoidales bacterium]